MIRVNMKFNLQRFADTTITVAPNLVQEAWAKDTWEAGFEKTFFMKFTGKSALDIVQIKEELKKEAGDAITIPLLMPLTGAGIAGDNILEGNEEALIYRDFKVSIDQIRNAVRLKGKMDEQKTQIDMRKDAKHALSNWLANHIDDAIFTALSTNPTADRTVFAGSATSEGTITTSDVFTADLIGKIKRVATGTKQNQVKPVKVDGMDTYVLVIDPFQARDLTSDQKWINAQQNANVRGSKNPIFTGALGMYNGVIVHESARVLRTQSGTSAPKVGHALFLGAQAAVMAVGSEPSWEEETFDYKNKVGFSFGRIFGIAKSQYKFDGTNLTDFGVINVLTSSADD